MENEGSVITHDVQLENRFSKTFTLAMNIAQEAGQFTESAIYSGLLFHGEYSTSKLVFRTDGIVVSVSIPNVRSKGKRKRVEKDPCEESISDNKNISKLMVFVEKDASILEACHRALQLLFFNLKLCKLCGHMGLCITDKEAREKGVVTPPCLLDENCFCFLTVDETTKVCSRCVQLTTLSLGMDANCVICQETFHDQTEIFLGKGCSQCYCKICAVCLGSKDMPSAWLKKCQTCKKDFFMPVPRAK